MLTIIRVTHPASYSLGFRQLYFSITLTCKRGTKPECLCCTCGIPSRCSSLMARI